MDDDFLRRLIPFPGAEALSPLSLLPRLAPGAAVPSNPVASAMPGLASQQAASIVTQAASILDEEMAKGVLAARSVGAGPHGGADASYPLLRQVHELVDNVASMWPATQSAPAQGWASSRPAGDADPLAEIRPRTTVKPGQRATISMTLRNSESHAVRLVPEATDLLGSRGGRIACTLLECTPRELSLEPQQQADVVIATTVPAEAAPGCYSGLLVVRGVDYLRALITIEVI